MIHWVDGVFTRWGFWLQTDRGVASKGQMAAWLEAGGDRSGPVATAPGISIECSRVNDWVKVLGKDDQVVMLQVYCSEQSSIEHARVLRMSTRTFYARLHSLQVAYTRRDIVRESRRQAQSQAPREKIYLATDENPVSPLKGSVAA